MSIIARKDISDRTVLKAYIAARLIDFYKYPYQILAEWTGEPEKVCYRAMERAESRGLIECGVSLRTGWLTKKGKDFFYNGVIDD